MNLSAENSKASLDQFVTMDEKMGMEMVGDGVVEVTMEAVEDTEQVDSEEEVEVDMVEDVGRHNAP